MGVVGVESSLTGRVVNVRNINEVIFKATAISTDMTGDGYRLDKLLIAAVQVTSTGTLDGVVEFQLSNDGVNWAGSNNFTDIPLVPGTTQLAQSSMYIGALWIRVFFNRTGGTGDLTCIMNAKGGA